jgi:hypothetical protein
MKLKPIIAAAGLALSASTASAEMLSKSEQYYVANSVSGVFVAMICDAKIKEGAMTDIADRLGIDDGLRKAVVAAMFAQMKSPYERGDLVPAVTRLVNEVEEMVASEITGPSKKAGCAKWVKILRDNGVLLEKCGWRWPRRSYARTASTPSS